MIKYQCPICDLSLFVVPYDDRLFCHSQHSFVFQNSIWYLYRNDDSWREIEKEAFGTIACLKEDGNYKEDSVEGIDRYPYFDVREHSTDINRVMFDMVKEFIENKRGSILEIGAKNCWAVNQFKKMGFEDVVATDISDDDKIALGFGGKLINYTGRYFDRVICDCAHLPFEDDFFDVIFMCSTLHHIREKRKSIQEVFRVLKKDGLFLTMGDNPRHPDRSLEDALLPVKREREKFNINETQPTLFEYYGFISDAGFSDYFFYPFDENLLRNNWNFGKSNMIVEILVRGAGMKVHPYTVGIINRLVQRDEKFKQMLTLERMIMLSYWLYVPNNVVMWAKK